MNRFIVEKFVEYSFLVWISFIRFRELLMGQREHSRRMQLIKLQEKGKPFEETEIGLIQIKLKHILAKAAEKKRKELKERMELERQEKEKERAGTSLSHLSKRMEAILSQKQFSSRRESTRSQQQENSGKNSARSQKINSRIDSARSQQINSRSHSRLDGDSDVSITSTGAVAHQHLGQLVPPSPLKQTIERSSSQSPTPSISGKDPALALSSTRKSIPPKIADTKSLSKATSLSSPNFNLA